MNGKGKKKKKPCRNEHKNVKKKIYCPEDNNINDKTCGKQKLYFFTTRFDLGRPSH